MNAIETVVMPVKVAAIERAAAEAQKVIDLVAAELTAAGNDRQVAAPYPSAMKLSRNAYLKAHAKMSLFLHLTKSRETNSNRPGSPSFADMSTTLCAKFITEAKENAAVQYDAFVAKLNSKIGAVTAAELTGNHVWGYSFLTVTKTTGTEIWKTQMIINVSKLGKLFNQFPTRKVKAVV